MPFAAYPAGELNALYDLTMYGSGFLNGAIALLIHIPDTKIADSWTVRLGALAVIPK
jgi:hypothetical protein